MMERLVLPWILWCGLSGVLLRGVGLRMRFGIGHFCLVQLVLEMGGGSLLLRLLLPVMILSFVSPPTRCDINPTTGSDNLGWHLWEIVNRNEHHFTCRVFVFNEVNQVITRVKSEPMLLKERRACTRGVGMALTKSRSFAGPSIFSQTTFSHSSDTTVASVATMDEHQSRVQLPTNAGRRPTKACTQSRRVVVIRSNEL